MTITNLYIYLGVAGSSLTSGRNFAGLYDSSRNLLSGTADQTTAWGSGGTKTMALSSAQAVAAGDYFVAFYWNGTTGPTIARGTTIAVCNVGLSTANSRCATSSSSLTTALPNPAAALASTPTAYWVAVS